jgi:hypothetical protein
LDKSTQFGSYDDMILHPFIAIKGFRSAYIFFKPFTVHLWSCTTTPSLTMTETAAGAPHAGRMPDAEKTPDNQRSAVDDTPNKAEPQESSPYDASSSNKADDEAEKKNKGSMRDYFVSAERDQACCIGLMFA